MNHNKKKKEIKQIIRAERVHPLRSMQAHTHREQLDLRVIVYTISVGGSLVVYCIGHIGACVIYLGSVIPSNPMTDDIWGFR